MLLKLASIIYSFLKGSPFKIKKFYTTFQNPGLFRLLDLSRKTLNALGALLPHGIIEYKKVVEREIYPDGFDVEFDRMIEKTKKEETLDEDLLTKARHMIIEPVVFLYSFEVGNLERKKDNEKEIKELRKRLEVG